MENEPADSEAEHFIASNIDSRTSSNVVSIEDALRKRMRFDGNVRVPDAPPINAITPEIPAPRKRQIADLMIALEAGPLKAKDIWAVHWDKTDMAEARLKNSPFFEEASPDGSERARFKGREIIGRDTPIQGGVYVGESSREAIVVDEKYGGLPKVYNELLKRRRKAMYPGILRFLWKQAPRAKNFKEGLLEEVFALVREKLPPSQAAVDEVARQYHLKGDQKIPLDAYLDKGGVCRHETLLGGWILEKLIKEGYIQGRVSVDRNFVPGQGGHAWIRYTNSRGKVFIIDAAQNYIGALEDVGKSTRWFYERPEDLPPTSEF